MKAARSAWEALENSSRIAPSIRWSHRDQAEGPTPLRLLITTKHCMHLFIAVQGGFKRFSGMPENRSTSLQSAESR
eukprot:6623389-Alexandrium_andersonii.AAC.1